jgi:hypothetical protein
VKTANVGGSNSSASVQCGTGKAVGGGGSTDNTSINLFSSVPLKSTGSVASTNGDVPTGWQVSFNGNANSGAGNSGKHIFVYVVCAS